MRAPLELGCRPSPACIMPALTSSSLNLPMAVSISVLGMIPASLSLFALTITMKRIAVSCGWPVAGMVIRLKDERRTLNPTLPRRQTSCPAQRGAGKGLGVQGLEEGFAPGIDGVNRNHGHQRPPTGDALFA